MAAPIKHLVVLMMENRSFDHLLGFFPGVNGLTGAETNPTSPGGSLVQVSRNARTVHDLNPDPGHEFANVNMQIFSSADGQDVGQPKMQGFVQDYAQVSGDASQGPNVMKCFTPATLPVLSKLAQYYAVSDTWFSSVPGSTIPNRLFAHAANSNASLTQDVIAAPFSLRTIFEVMDEPDNSYPYRIYTSDSSVLMANLYLMERRTAFHPIDELATDLANGDVAAYTFIEPRYGDDLNAGLNANSQHPDFAVDEGEAFITQVYEALKKSPGWHDTLLLIVYDEHGGIFDHVFPPTVAPTAANTGLPDVIHSTDPPFDFRRLGVRVPAVFVSPRISPRVISDRIFDHCSIVSTVRKLFCDDPTPFNWREAQAPSFDDLVDLDAPRPDITLPPPFASPGVTNAEIAVAHQAEALVHQGAAPQTAANGVIQAAALPKLPPAQRKPTDLVMKMAQAMAHSLDKRGLKTPTSVNEIYSSQDAADYLKNAKQLLRMR